MKRNNQDNKIPLVVVHEMNKKVLLILASVILLLGIGQYVLINFYIFVLNPAILSNKLGCEIEVNQEIESCNVQGWYDPNKDEITILSEENSKEYDFSLKHEECHRRQNEQKRLASCNNKIGSIFNEMECYLVSGESFDAFKNLRLGQ